MFLFTTEGRSPVEPQPDDSYFYQPPPEPLQYPAFDNTHLRNASPCSFHSSMSLWTKWMRTTLLSSLVMYSMLSRLITLSPTRSKLLMVHLLPPKSRAGTPRRIPRPAGYLLISCASPTRNGLEDLYLFAGTGFLDKATDVDDALVAGVGAFKTSVMRFYGVVVVILGGWVRVVRYSHGVNLLVRLAGSRGAPTPAGPFP